MFCSLDEPEENDAGQTRSGFAHPEEMW